MQAKEVVIIGAGVIGLSIAIALQAEGASVTIFDREGPAAGASAGNAGAFAFSDVLPLASPGILRKAPKWLLDPLGPLSVPPAYALKIAPWMYRFWRACAPAQVAASTTAQVAMMRLSEAELVPLLRLSGTEQMLHKRGNLQVYEGEAEFRASVPSWDLRRDYGIDVQHMDAAEMADLQPGLAARFTHGTFTPKWYSIADPKLYCLALAEAVRAQGGVIERAEVVDVQPSADGVRLTLQGGRQLAAGQVVVAAGAFSHQLAARLGDKIPLETERGYNTTLPENAYDLRTQVTFGGHGFVVSRLSSGIRVGGAVELGGLKLPPNFKRSAAMLAKAKSFLPALRTEGGRQWMGFRPSLPDSLPVIGHAKASARVVYAFGHGHLGLTQSAGTARLVRDLILDRAPALDLEPFAAHRF